MARAKLFEKKEFLPKEYRFFSAAFELAII